MRMKKKNVKKNEKLKEPEMPPLMPPPVLKAIFLPPYPIF